MELILFKKSNSRSGIQEISILFAESENTGVFSVEAVNKSVIESNEVDVMNSVSFNCYFRYRRSFKFRNLPHSKYLYHIYLLHRKHRDLHTENSFSAACELISQTCHTRLGSPIQFNTAQVDTSTQPSALFLFILHNLILFRGCGKKFHRSPPSTSLSLSVEQLRLRPYIPFQSSNSSVHRNVRVMNFTSDKLFGMVNISQYVVEGNTVSRQRVGSLDRCHSHHPRDFLTRVHSNCGQIASVKTCNYRS